MSVMCVHLSHGKDQGECPSQQSLILFDESALEIHFHGGKAYNSLGFCLKLPWILFAKPSLDVCNFSVCV